jgi:hypothetical protein
VKQAGFFHKLRQHDQREYNFFEAMSQQNGDILNDIFL